MSIDIANKPTFSAPTPIGGADNMERICDNTDCSIVKLVSMVPKRKTAQIIIEPNIIEKPMLINGFTTVFQVDGRPATMNDLITPSVDEQNTIYRIKPDTHAHIVNYVVVDGKGDCLRKINAGEPNIMRKLLESQRSSARQLLQKLMNGPATKVHVTNSGLPPPVAPTAAPQAVPAITAPPVVPTAAAPTLPVALPPTLQTVGNGITIPSNGTQIRGPTASSTAGNTSLKTISNNSQPTKYYSGNTNMNRSLPMESKTQNTSGTNVLKSTTFRVGPQIKITPVSASGAKNTASPLIKTVPLSQLQKPSFNSSTTISLVKGTNSPAGVSKPTVTTPNTTTIKKIVAKPLPTEVKTAPPATANASDVELFERMQKELEELRRSVAMLAEAQAKTVQTPAAEPPSKKARVDT